MALNEALQEYFASHNTPVQANRIGQILKDHSMWIQNNPEFDERQKKAASMIAACKTEALGYYVEYCPNCDQVVGIHYRSCKNHCCPNCQTSCQIKWSLLREAEIIPNTTYFHVVMTLPHDLNSLILANTKELLRILFRASSEAVIQLSLDPRFLGAKPGIISVCHTWTQELQPHFHIHMIVSGGGLDKNGFFVRLKDGWEKRVADSENDTERNESTDASVPENEALVMALMEEDSDMWNDEDRNTAEFQETLEKKKDKVPFFLPEKALAKLFRGKYLTYLSELYRQKKLRLPGELDYLNDPWEWSALGQKLGSKNWIAHIVRTFQGNGNAIEYLARYTFRTAISNSRIIEYDGKNVTITCRDNEDYRKKRKVILSVYEFIRRFLLHVPPKGFTRIRYSGFLSNSQKVRNLAMIFEQVSHEEYRPAEIKKCVEQIIVNALKKHGFQTECPCCGTELSIIGVGVNFLRRRRCVSPAA